MNVAEEVKHDWKKGERKQYRLRGGKRVTSQRYECPNCGQWTSNLPLYKNEVCPAKDRRKLADRRKS